MAMKILLAALVAILCFLAPSYAQANGAGAAPPVVVTVQILCLPEQWVEARLADDYGEIATEAGSTGRGDLARIYTSDETWTFTLTHSAGGILYSCPVTSGFGWRPVEPVSLDPRS